VPRLARGRERWECDERVLGSSEFVHAALTRLSAEPVRPRPDSGGLLAGLRARVADAFEVTAGEIASPSRRRHALAARAFLCDLAVCHHGVPLSVVARALAISRPSVARAVYAEHGCAQADFLDS